jgi:uncharacterized phosphosugar-binding protein
MTARGRFLAGARDIIGRIEETQGEALAAASRQCADAIGPGGLVHVFGTGHSRIPVEEMFPRYGSYPGFNPIVELSMTFHTEVVGANGQRQAMFIERVEGLAEQILANFELSPPDVMIVFSASGVTAVPIEMAQGARARGLGVIAVTSIAQSLAAAPSHSSGTRLLDNADIVIDLCTPPGDAIVEIDGLATPVAPGSTIAAVAIANEIKAQTAVLLAERGALPPVLTSATLVGAKAADALFDAAYAEHARRLARVLRGSQPQGREEGTEGSQKPPSETQRTAAGAELASAGAATHETQTPEPREQPPAQPPTRATTPPARRGTTGEPGVPP